MIMKNIICHNCGLNMEYWTKANYIKCTKCNGNIAVEPCEEVIIEVKDGDIEVFPDESER